MERAVLLVIFVALVSGCGSPAKSVGAVEDAVRSYTAAFLSGQGEKAADMLSSRCNTPALRTDIVQAAAVAPASYGQAKLISVSPIVSGNRAAVTYRFDQPAIDQESQPWGFESGTWRYDKC